MRCLLLSQIELVSQWERLPLFKDRYLQALFDSGSHVLHLGSVAHILVQPPKPKLEVFTSNYVVAEDLCLSIAFLVSTMFIIVLSQSFKGFEFQISYGSFFSQTCVQPLFLPQKAQMLQCHHNFTHQANLIVKSICKHEGRLQSRGALVCSWSRHHTILRFALLSIIILR